ncbi:MAG: D-alanine--D-alanine ligase [Gammaproteobacteria bacterium]|jgi:D-alanine-D-alanine ligase|nr:D-alanine--D-alanine ligase [Gammaproteobacteria bacterium]
MQSKIRVAILFGGRSAEHEVSLQSARNVIDAIDQEKYETVLIGIDRRGAWLLNEESIALLDLDDPRLITLKQSNQAVSLVAGDQAGALVDLKGGAPLPAIDVLFPVLHGPYGEDGSVQGLAKLANVACVGSDILGSAIAMDKDISKRLLRAAGIPVARHLCLRRGGLTADLRQQLEQEFGYPIYAKPANMGSSVGVTKVARPALLEAAVETALQYDIKAVLEENIVAREIECAVLGNDDAIASAVGEIGTDDGFYSYEKKYIDDAAAQLIIPAKMKPATLQRVQQTALAAFKALECRGMARVDMFLTADDEIYVNEINTIPGFTAISMYPKLWQATGLSYTDLIDRLIQLAIEEHALRSQLKTTGY